MGLSVTQNRLEMHDRSSPMPCIRINQVEPVQVPERAKASPVMKEEYVPVATQNLGEPHDTSLNSLPPPGGAVSGSTDHTTPFQCSARSWVGPPTEACSSPTAVQADQDVHDTDSSSPVPGEGTTLNVMAAARPVAP